MTGFKDHFSSNSSGYAAHRPSYPSALVEFLANQAPGRALAWDCGCGSGQLSLVLAGVFDRVIATDASAAQIGNATPHPRIEYRCATAEASGLPDASIDLAVAAQAAHWFDLPAYYAEVRRVARPGAVVALVCYGVFVVDADLRTITDRFYSETLEHYWPPERIHVEDGYRAFAFPFDEFHPPHLEIRVNWNLAGLLGYIETWSAVRAMEKAGGRDAIDAFGRELSAAWGDKDSVRSVHWPLGIRAGRV